MDQEIEGFRSECCVPLDLTQRLMESELCVQRVAFTGLLSMRTLSGEATFLMQYIGRDLSQSVNVLVKISCYTSRHGR